MDGYVTEVVITPKEWTGTTTLEKFDLKAEIQLPSTTEMFSDLQQIFVSTIHNLQQSSYNQRGGLNSKQINDLSKLITSMTALNKEVRESTKESSNLQGLSFNEQLAVLLEALKTLGVMK